MINEKEFEEFFKTIDQTIGKASARSVWAYQQSKIDKLQEAIDIKRAAEILSDFEFYEDKLECEDCGNEGLGVAESYCPHAEDVSGRKLLCVLCSTCYTKRCDDI